MVSGIGRIHPAITLPACMLGGAALRYALIQVNQLAVKKLGWDWMDHHTGWGSLEDTRKAFCRQAIKPLEVQFSFPKSSRVGITLWIAVLCAITYEVCYRFFLERKILPRLLPESIKPYACLGPVAFSVSDYFFIESPRQTMVIIHTCCADLVCSLAQKHLGLPGAIFTRLGYDLYSVHYLTGYLTKGKRMLDMNPVDLIHWKTIQLFTYHSAVAIIPRGIQRLFTAENSKSSLLNHDPT